MVDRVVGIHTQVKDKMAKVHLVVLEEASAGVWAMKTAATFEPDKGHSLPDRMLELSKWLTHHLDGAAPRAAIVTDMDQKGRNSATTLLNRHTADGLALALLRAKADKVQMQAHTWIASRLGQSKLEAQGNAASECGEEYKEAGAAARAALTL